MNWYDSHLLSVVTFLPLLGALVVAFLPSGEHGQHKGIALFASCVTALASLQLWFGFNPGGGWQFEQKTEWAPAWGFSYHIGLDGVALLLFLLTTILSPIVILSAWKFTEKSVKEFCIALLVLETAMLGTLAALDLVLFYVFWEAMLIPMYLLVGVWGSEKRIYAAVKFFLFTFVGSVLMLLAIFYLWTESGTGGAARTFDYVTLMQQAQFSPQVQSWLFLAFALAFAIKVPVFPLHTWLPDAHTEAPAVGSVLLAGVMLKLGTFGFIRYAMPLFPQAALAAAPTIAALGIVGIVYGSLMCMAQKDLKRMIAYSSVAHLGFVMTGLAALNAEAVSGAVLQMVNHGISTGGLFLVIGYLYERTHTRDLANYGGLAKVVPGLAAVFLVITLSSIGLPGTNGFIGEFLILLGTFTSKIAGGQLLAVIAATGVILGAVYMLFMYQRVMFGPITREENRSLEDLSFREWTTLVPLLFAIVAIGVFPSPLLDAVKAPVDEFVARVTKSGGLPIRAQAREGEVRPAGNPPGLAPGNPGDVPAAGANTVVRPFFPNRAPLAAPAQPNP